MGKNKKFDDREEHFLPPELKDSHIDYWDKLSKEEKKFMKQFNDEYHGKFGHTGKKNKMLTDEEDVQNTNRQINNRERDVFIKALSKNRLLPIMDNLLADEEDEPEWLTVYKDRGMTAARRFINQSFDKDLQNKYIDKDVTEARRTITLKQLKTIHERRGKHK